MNPLIAVAMPGGALGIGLFLIAMPIMLVMTIWAAFTMARILFPERPLQIGRVPRSLVQRRRRGATSVRLHDLLEEEERSPSKPAMPASRAMTEGDQSDADLLWEDLWLRRN